MSEPEPFVVLDGDKPSLGRNAPAWAHHLHDCMHSIKAQQQTDRHNAANRDMALEGQLSALQTTLDKVLKAIGEEPNSEGQGATGLIARMVHFDRRLKPFETWRERMMGGLMAGTLLIGVVWWLIQDKLALALK